ncbi:hypothetical protein, partial [Burkholderia pyrrocinia]|uniref:hypothetical protein n=1 Tax=Burkholderia pyrrocinia TaxID=60550 RepID=UPI001ABA0E65
GVFGPIHTSSGFAGFMHEYACSLQIQQHRFALTSFLHKPYRIIQGRLSTAVSVANAQTENTIKSTLLGTCDRDQRSSRLSRKTKFDYSRNRADWKATERFYDIR